jgi:hypothetical protein
MLSVQMQVAGEPPRYIEAAKMTVAQSCSDVVGCAKRNLSPVVGYHVGH